MADRIRVSTEMLEKWGRELAVIRDGLTAAEGILGGVSVSEGFWEALSVTANERLNNGARIAGGSAAEVVRSLRGALGRTSEASGEVSLALLRSARLFEDAELDIEARIDGDTSEGELSDGHGDGSGHPHHKHGIGDRPDSAIAKKARDWGRKKGTISDAEYAFLSNATNIGCREKNTVDKKKAFMDQLSQLPPGHPLRDIDPHQVKIFDAMGVEGFIIELDDHSAIVVFAGTDDFIDVIADAGIASAGFAAVSPMPVNPVKEVQQGIANLIIGNLERRGYDNIQVTGHSLGGYLATDVAIRHGGVSECVTFDAPKHTASDVALHYRESTSKDFRNYIPNGSIVNKAGMVQPGTTTKVTVKDNMAGPLPNHQILRIYEDGLGGKAEIDRQWRA